MKEQEKWQAVLANDPHFDGRFFYAVKTTGVFCKPSCKSRPPRVNNVLFFNSAAEAEAAGFAPCKRCRPDLPDYQPLVRMAAQIKETIDNFYRQRGAMLEQLGRLKLSPRRMAQVFVAQYGQTPSQYADSLRIKAAKDYLQNSMEGVADIAFMLGFESLSAFYAFFHKHTQTAPKEFRKHYLQAGAFTYRHAHAYDTPLGKMAIASDGQGIIAAQLASMAQWSGVRAADKLTDQAARQLEEYFAGRRKVFELPLNPAGSVFQKAVWQALQAIPYGHTMSYKQVAAYLGNPKASRAVGAANNKNPLLIIVPCHRVVGAGGALVGYAAGLGMKRRLLELELQHRDGLP